MTLYAHFGKSHDKNSKPEFKVETYNLNKEYCDILDELYQFIRNNDGVVDDLRSVVQEWLPCGTVWKNDRFHKINKDNLEDLDLRKLWTIFSSYSSFFNFELLERVIRRIGFEKGKCMMECYRDRFASYIKNRVTKCPSGIGMKGENHVKLLVKLDEYFENCNMDKLKLLGQDICRIIKADPEKLQVEKVEMGCVCITFHLHMSAIPDGFWLTEDEITQFQSLQYMNAKILKLQCGDVDFIIADIGKTFADLKTIYIFLLLVIVRSDRM